MAQVQSGSDSAQLPPQGIRTLISLLLFIHLFALALVMTSYVSPSALQARLKSVFGGYMQPLNFDFYNYSRFYLTHFMPTDLDYGIEVSSKDAAGQSQTLTLPPAELFLPLRSRRYQALANAAGSLATSPGPGEPIDEEAAAILPKSIAASLLSRQGAKSGTIRVRMHYVMPIEDFESTTIARRDPLDPSRYNTTYEAQVLLRPGGVDLLKTSAAGDVAPVDKESK